MEMAVGRMATVFGVADVERVLTIARKFPIFPCGPDKRPRVASGFHAATQDEKQIRQWWRQWPDALVGVPTGQTTGLVVIDYDPDKATSATHSWISEHTELLCSTRNHKTGRGGLHYLFRSTDRYQTGVDLVLGGSPRRGIDLRANGGYVIWWPAHVTQGDETPVAPLPANLIDERRFDAQRDMAPLPKATPAQWRGERARVLEALGFVAPDGYENWIRIGMAVHSASGGSDDGFALWHDWSATAANYDGIEDCRYHWASFGRYQGRGIGLGSLYAQAKEAGFSPAPSRPELPPVDVYEGEPVADDYERVEEEDEQPAEVVPASRLINWAALAGKEPPPRNWRIPEWMSDGPMLFSGRGGAGKSTIAQALGTALALGRPYFQPAGDRVRVLCWQCEDSHDEMWRRQLPILEHFDAGMTDLVDWLHVDPRLGQENTLLAPVFGSPTWTPAMQLLREQVNDLQIDVLFLDNIGHCFGANENARHDVTMFVNGMAGLVTGRPFTAVLMGHTARSQGSEFAGSAAWENAVRMRWWLGHTLPDQPEPDEGNQADPNVRYLAKRKANYASRDVIRMVYDQGLFLPDMPEASISDRYNSGRYAEEARNAVLFAIRKAQETSTRLVKGKNSPDSLIRWMRNLNLGTTFTEPQLLRALDELTAAGRVGEGTVGVYGNRTKKTGLVAK